jgi:signal transduction histidine kinase
MASSGQAAGMLDRLRSLFDPMRLAAYLVWVAIGSELWRTAPRTTGLIDNVWLWPSVIALHAGFLLLFLAGALSPGNRVRRGGLVAIQIAITLCLVATARGTMAPILLIVVMAQSALLYRPSVLALLFIVVNLAMYLIFRMLWQTSAPIVELLIYASFQLFAMLTAWYAVTAERSRDALATVNADLLATHSLLAESARDSERLRLARELHDVAGHKLTALKLNLAAATRDPRWQASAPIVLCAQLADELLADIRGVVQQMRLHDGIDLRSALEALATPFPRPKLQLQLDAGIRVTHIAQAEAILRTVQEALTNAARHSQAEYLWVVLRREGDRLVLDIRDDGRSPGALRFGSGLSGMRERLEALGGQLQVDRQPGEGVHLLAWVPVIA